MIRSSITQWNISSKIVFIRADLNVPLHNGTILDDFKLAATKPTLDYVLQKEGTIILASHIGKPKQPDSLLSTQHLIPWFITQGYQCIFAENPNIIASLLSDTQIIILENLRFFPGEINRDPLFAQSLAQHADFYINDAFGSLHRDHTSITLLPKLFAPEKRSIGLLVQKELQFFNTMRTQPQKPFTLVLGGAKTKTKIPLIHGLFPLLDTILLCPAIVFTFLKVLGKPIGQSFVDTTTLDTCKQILHTAQDHAVKIIFPLDYQVAHSLEGNTFFITPDATIDHHMVGISIGPKTSALYTHEIKTAHTIFFNGGMGFLEKKKTLQGTLTILQAMAESKGKSIIAGGDTVAMAHQLGMTHYMDYVSTGGGATLAYLSKNPLPGLLALES